MLNEIEAIGVFVFYVGIKKTAPPHLHYPNRLYTSVLLEAIKRIGPFCADDCNTPESFLVCVIRYIARNHVRNGSLVLSRIVPAVSEIRCRQPRH